MRMTRFTFISISVYFIILITFMLCFNISQTMLHEETHAAINKQYGCDSKINYHWLGITGETTAFDCINNPQQETARTMLNSQNEIVGYNANIIITLLSMIAASFIWVVCLVIVALTIERRSKKNGNTNKRNKLARRGSK